jgi:hypothetical protein
MCSVLLAYILALLLAGTSPTGTGQGVHQGMLLDSMLPHLHFVDGKVVEPGASPQGTNVSTAGPSLGAAAGAAATMGSGLNPPPSTIQMVLPAAGELRRFVAAGSMPRGRTEAPPDPPPTVRA